MVFITDKLEQNRRAQPLCTSRFVFDPSEIEGALRARIIGQDETIARFKRQLSVVKAGLQDDRKPLLSTLFLGSTGVGKTEFVRTVAKAIHGNSEAFCRIDMNTLSQSHYSAAITGAPPGYVGSKENYSLFNEDHIAGTSTRPGIVLFDEIEKASAEVVRSLMNILDSGSLTLASGQKTLKFNNTLIFMTSNIGASKTKTFVSKARQSFSQKSRKATFIRALERHFDPEFINRIGSVNCFNDLSMTSIPDIIENLEAELNQRLKVRNIAIELDSSARTLVCSAGFNKRYGARDIQRQFQAFVLEPLAQFLLSTEEDQCRFIFGTATANKITFQPTLLNEFSRTSKPVASRPSQEKTHD